VLSIASIKSNVAENPLKSKSEHSNNHEKEEQWCGCRCVVCEWHSERVVAVHAYCSHRKYSVRLTRHSVVTSRVWLKCNVV
jgi:hypothetical protein